MKRLKAIFFLIVLLSSNAGFAMTTHLCGGEPVETAVMLGHSDLDCGMASSGVQHDLPLQTEDAAWLSDMCCENQFLDLSSDEAITIKVKTVDLQPEFIALLLFSFDLIQVEEEDFPPLTYYSPPVLKQDLPVLFQVFII